MVKLTRFHNTGFRLTVLGCLQLFWDADGWVAFHFGELSTRAMRNNPILWASFNGNTRAEWAYIKCCGIALYDSNKELV
jgi:hypothetical protein